MQQDALLNLLNHESEYLRSWAIQLLAEDKALSPTALKRFAELAKTDTSALVRLYLTSATQRTAPQNRWEIIEALLQRTEDKADHNLPLMLWYTFEPVVATDINRAIALAQKTNVPNILPFTIRRIGAMKTAESIKALEGLQVKLENASNAHEGHEVLALVKKVLGGE